MLNCFMPWSIWIPISDGIYQTPLSRACHSSCHSVTVSLLFVLFFLALSFYYLTVEFLSDTGVDVPPLAFPFFWAGSVDS